MAIRHHVGFYGVKPANLPTAQFAAAAQKHLLTDRRSGAGVAVAAASEIRSVAKTARTTVVGPRGERALALHSFLLHVHLYQCTDPDNLAYHFVGMGVRDITDLVVDEVRRVMRECEVSCLRPQNAFSRAVVQLSERGQLVSVFTVFEKRSQRFGEVAARANKWLPVRDPASAIADLDTKVRVNVVMSTDGAAQVHPRRVVA